MKATFTKLFFLALLSLFAAAGCARQTGGPAAVSIDALAGAYRVLWDDDSPNDRFTLEQKNDVWNMSDQDDSIALQKMSPTEIEEALGQEAAGKAQCLEGFNETARVVICVAEPGFTTTVRVDGPAPYSKEFTSKTGYFVYVDSIDIWDLEKLK